MTMSAPSPQPRGPLPTPTLALWGLLAAAATWACWPALVEMSQRWAEDPTYSHGYLVPAFALALLWMRRDRLQAVPIQPSWWGATIVVLGIALLAAGDRFYVRWLGGAGYLLMLAGAAAAVGGGRLLALAAPAVAYLVFMIPLPYRVESAMRAPLQRVASTASTFFMQAIGLPAIQRGNVIDVDGALIGVEEACSGLKMMITFVALAVGMVMVIRRPWIDKLVILASAVPIAIVSNVIRVAVTGVLHVTVGGKVAEFVYHDVAGFLMMPLGVALMWLLMVVMEHLFVEAEPSLPTPLDPMLGAGRRPAGRIGRA
jgi:exosortase